MSGEKDSETNPMPKENRSAREIVEIQIEAMAENDQPHEDAGIETAYDFASPGNKASTGPIDRFKKMVKNPRYRHMLDSDSYTIKESEIGETEASFKAELMNNGSSVTYEFNVSIQTSGEYEGCWMTDSVLQVD